MGNIIKLSSFFCIIVLILAVADACPALGDEEEDCMVYALKSEQDMIYEIVQKDKSLQYDNLKILKESITPDYIIKLLSYAETGNFEMKRYYKEGCPVYIAKMITSDGKYGGNIRFYIKDNEMHEIHFSPSDALEKYADFGHPGSCSYADHAERIKSILKKENFVSVYDVRHVLVNDIGNFFYIKDGEREILIPQDNMLNTVYLYPEPDWDLKPKFAIENVIMDVHDELKELALRYWKKYNDDKLYREQWEKEHPGDLLIGGGGGGGDVIPVIVKPVNVSEGVNNILHIAEYLDIDFVAKPANIQSNIQSPAKKNSAPRPIVAILAGISVAVAAALALLFVFIKKRRIK